MPIGLGDRASGVAGDKDSSVLCQLGEFEMRSSKRFFTDAEMRSLLKAVRTKATRGTLTDKVDYALVIFAYATGCRACEIASVCIDTSRPNHIDCESGVVAIHDAKWDSRGVIPLDAGCLRVIKRYIRDVRPRLRNVEFLDTLFVTKTGSAYSPNTMSKKLSLLLTRLGFPEKTSHSFRHYLATEMARRGVNLAITAQILRHRDIRSTAAYTRPTVDDMRSALNRRLGRADGR